MTGGHLLSLTALFCFGLGCGGNRHASAGGAEYFISVGGALGWQNVEPGSADAAWWNPKIRGTIYADSHCGGRYEDNSLDRLSAHLTAGLEQAAELERVEFTVGKRAALMRVVEGQLDGVPIRIGAVVFKRNRCNFDVLYIAPPDQYDAGRDVFLSTVESFRAEEQG